MSAESRLNVDTSYEDSDTIEMVKEKMKKIKIKIKTQRLIVMTIALRGFKVALVKKRLAGPIDPLLPRLVK